MDRIMSNVRKKQINDTIVKTGFQIIEFEFKPTGQSEFTIIFKADSDYKFETINDKGSIFCEYSPASDGRLYTKVGAASWGKIIDAVSYWLRYLRLELDAGDPWNAIEDMLYEHVNFGDQMNETFTKDDINSINEKLDKVLQSLKEVGIDVAKLKDDIDYLKSATNRTSKKDWSLMMMGCLMGWIFNNYIPKEYLSTLVHTIVHLTSTIAANIKLIEKN